MSVVLEQELARLRREFTAHAASCFEALERAREALRTGDTRLAQRVIEDDALVDREEVHIESECVRLITLHHPVAHDLRLLIAMLKLNDHLERIADHAANVCHQARKIVRRGGSLPEHLLELADRVVANSRQVFQAFLDRDLALARESLGADAAVDRLDRTVRHEVQTMLDEEGEIGSSLAAYRISRELERIGDHLSNMAEDTIYLITGEIVRHGAAG
jgi:phosphate transport system protein